VPEVEEDDPASTNGSGAAQQQPAAAPAANIHRLEAETNVTGGLQEMPRPAATAGGQNGPAPLERPPQESLQPSPAANAAHASLTQPAVAAPLSSAPAVGPTPGVPVGKAGGLQSRQDVAAQRRRRPGAANGTGAGSMGSGGGMSAADAQAAVAANLARLSAARKAAAEEAPEEVRILHVCFSLSVVPCGAWVVTDHLRAVTGSGRARRHGLAAARGAKRRWPDCTERGSWVLKQQGFQGPRQQNIGEGVRGLGMGQ